MGILAIGPTDPVPAYQASIYHSGTRRPFQLVNLDMTSPVYYDHNPTVTATSHILYPKGRAGFDGHDDVWLSTAGGPVVMVDMLFGHTGWDPGPQQIALELQTSGIPPAVPNIKSAQTLQQPIGVSTFFTFSKTGRLWASQITYDIATNGSYPAGTINETYAQVKTGSGLCLGIVELAIAAASDKANGTGGLPQMPGIPVNGGETLQIDVNNNAGVANLQQRASAIVLYSIP